MSPRPVLRVVKAHPGLPEKVLVYAVLRLDLFQRKPEGMVTIKEVLPDRAEALSEVERLNALQRDDQVRYLVQTTRFFPRGLARK